MPRNDVTFGLLGALQVRAGGLPLDVRGTVVNHLLGALLIHANAWVSHSRLASLTWGEADASRNALHCAVARLRRMLGDAGGRDAGIEHSGAGYRIIVEPDRLDAARFSALARLADEADKPDTRFEALLRALRTWRGPVLAESSEWLRMDPAVLALERDRLERTYELGDLALRLDRASLALPLVEQLAAHLPFDEPLHARLLTLMAAVGRRAEALRAYGRVRRRLADELGVDPSDVLREAHLALLNAQTRTAAPAAGTADGRSGQRIDPQVRGLAVGRPYADDARSGRRPRTAPDHARSEPDEARLPGAGALALPFADAGRALPLDRIADAVLGRR
ncbi:DNA-binding SARP family transcriptional activator [Micromonospora sp. M71_S20]|uniref:AfsR/SARP family transcriptional regulator n=1 Tax=Micromonospora sp. M71_S20 TaxID=592872 RepID=UPI000EB5AB40|nr:BTAD domain-containing putative transcriptional regulator [Micromonospora sp. M71_S20]RLK25446.1 DNA-binding SARP family transcriptional activator [Micromonospora sp. M71_S20]